MPRPPAPRPLGERVREWLDWFGLGRLVAVAVSVAAVAGGGWWLLHAPPPATESRLPFATATTSGVPSTSLPPASLLVHVAGAVAAPGVLRLPEGARVFDAIAAAGGLAADADTDVLNLAAPLHDGDRVFVPRRGEPVPAVVGPGSGSGSTSGPVNLNTATAEQLDSLPGVGPATAAAIVAHREQHGPFASVEELTDVRGIGPAKLDAMRPLVTV